MVSYLNEEDLKLINDEENHTLTSEEVVVAFKI